MFPISKKLNKIFRKVAAFLSIATIHFSILAQGPSTTQLVDLSGVNNLGRDHNITGFFMNNKYYGTVGRGIGGGGRDCCIGIPAIWRPNMKIVVQWTVSIWDENLQPNASGTYTAPKVLGVYSAAVPVEKYEKPNTLYIHFFRGGKARIVSSEFGALSAKHPILLNDPRAIIVATQGKKIKPVLK
jgi:hypothetical protein